jgi:hypothetical protein
VACYNWENRVVEQELTPELFHLPAGDYFARSFWDGHIGKMSAVVPLHTHIQAHGVCLLALHKPQPVMYLGSDIHISQGLEVRDWSVGVKSITIHFEINRVVDGVIDLLLPGLPERAVLGDQPCRGTGMGEGIWRFAIHMDKAAVFSVYMA